MTKVLVIFAVLAGVATPALAQDQGEVSAQRAATMERCHHEADAKFGLSGVRDWRRYNSDFYAACMADAGQPQ